MKKLSSDQIRQLFLDYFKKNGHMIEPSASLVPINDPTLLWINAGVAALKKYFDGTIKPECPRIANAQKSIRTNDIENVGKTARHHTFFEMLGNFSIGDYFKSEAIHFAWEFLTSEEYIGFDKNRLYVTVHPSDTEAYRIWTEETDLNPQHILKTEGNFWEIGEGPSGPDTEIFYDRGEAYDPDHLGERAFFEELENDRFIEIWNVVFSQYDAKEGVERSAYKELPQKNIDTGMGLERLVCVIQQGETNYDTDLFMPIIRATEQLAKHPYSGEYKMAYRVVADHIRTVTFALSDGALFANEGRGYVLRRVLRRAVRYGIKLGIEGSFMYKLVSVVAENMKSFYPYLSTKVDYVSKLVKAEEERFHQTLTAGEKLLMEVINTNRGKVLSGEVVFKLYDTFGFPYELTKEIAIENGLNVDETGFRQAMEQQRERARNAREESESMASQSVDLMNFDLPSQFTGYETLEGKAKVIGLFKDGQTISEIVNEGEAVFDLTPFYAESGGQIADIGNISGSLVKGRIIDVRKAPHKQFLHHIVVEEGSISVGDDVFLQVDQARRKKIRANHSAAHLLQAALKQVLGSHIAQAGSYVSDSYLRFDFTHFEKVTAEQLRAIETLVNNYIYRSLPVFTTIMNLDDAKQSGATALFDEKYESKVRVVTMGDVSKELCGGTHVTNTSDVGIFKIVSEESIGSGIRRITSLSGYGAYQEFLAQEDKLIAISKLLKTGSLSNVTEKTEQLIQENHDLQETISGMTNRLMNLKAEELLSQIVVKNDLNIIISEIKDADSSNLKTIIDNLKNKINNSVLFLYNISNDKVVYTVYCSPEAIRKGLKAGELAKEAAILSGGGGGGRPDLAQSGGKDITKIEQVLQVLANKLGLTI
ncbi:MAG: alanine--tRNA ligase [Erysipelotrichaceae bacterium]|nr:alanine--tRNA ligase [Erysipelotrichaceae bacterium]